MMAGKAVEVVCFFAMPVALALHDRVATVHRVSGCSMQPTINPSITTSDFVWTDRLKASKFDFERGDVVVFKEPSRKMPLAIKRIVGLEGDTVTSRYRAEFMVPPGHCWVEGDNGRFSMDSNTYGPIPMGLITGKVTHIVWPPGRWQKLESKEMSMDRVTKYTDMDTFPHAVNEGSH